jgi:Icc protein
MKPFHPQSPPQQNLKVRAKFWGESEAVRLSAHIHDHTLPMRRIEESQVWEVDIPSLPNGVYDLFVNAEDEQSNIAIDAIRLRIGDRTPQEHRPRDQDNAPEAWPEHGLLGTQLGPNKNGKKW